MATNKYLKLIQRQQTDWNNFPIFYAFGDSQFNELLIRLNIKEEEADKKLISVGYGGLVLAEDYSRLMKMTENHKQELKNAISKDKTGEGFIYDMFITELNNHEYSYTRDATDAIEACRCTEEDFKNNPALVHGLQKAIRHILKRK